MRRRLLIVRGRTGTQGRLKDLLEEKGLFVGLLLRQRRQSCVQLRRGYGGRSRLFSLLLLLLMLPLLQLLYLLLFLLLLMLLLRGGEQRCRRLFLF